MITIGIDISDRTFTASCSKQNFEKIFSGKTFEQNRDGWEKFLVCLDGYHLPRNDTHICMEATGVYGERLCHFLHEHGFSIYVEPPRTIKKAFYEGEKTDPVDSRQIAEYPFRFPDRIHHWMPPNELIDQLKTLLTARELITKNRTACKNTQKSLGKKQHQGHGTQTIYTTLIAHHKAAISAIDEEMHTIINANPIMSLHITNILTIKSVGFLLAVNLAVITNGFTQHVRYQSLSRYVGVCPLRYESGTSVYHRPSADGAGPSRLRKLLYLSAMRLKRTNADFQKYFDRKIAEGKPPKLVLNNIANRTLRLICGVIKSEKPYIQGYKTIKP